MICPKCGFEIREGLTFCPKCGLELESKLTTTDNEGRMAPIAKTSENVTKERKQGNITVNTGDGSSSQDNSYRGTEAPKEKFYQKTWFIVLMLIFVCPLGVALMWLYSSWNKVVKIIITSFIVIAVVFSILSDGSSNSEGEDIKDKTQDTSVEPKQITADDILSLSKGDCVEIKCNRGDFLLRAQDEEGKRYYFVDLYATDSKGIEWKVDGGDVVGSNDTINTELNRIVDEHISLEEDEYQITIRGIVNYAGEGEEGSGHPHGINFMWGSGEIIQLKHK